MAHVKEDELEHEEEDVPRFRIQDQLFLEQQPSVISSEPHPGRNAQDCPRKLKIPAFPGQTREDLPPPGLEEIPPNYSLSPGRLLPPRAEDEEKINEANSPLISPDHNSAFIASNSSIVPTSLSRPPPPPPPSAAPKISLAALAKQLREKSNGANVPEINNNATSLTSLEQKLFRPHLTPIPPQGQAQISSEAVGVPTLPLKLTSISEELKVTALQTRFREDLGISNCSLALNGAGDASMEKAYPQTNVLCGAEADFSSLCGTSCPVSPALHSLPPAPKTTDWAASAQYLPSFYNVPTSQSYFPPGAIEKAIGDATNLINSTKKVLLTQSVPPQCSQGRLPAASTAPTSVNFTALMPPSICGVGRGAYRKRQSPFVELRRPWAVTESSLNRLEARREHNQKMEQPGKPAVRYYCHQCEKELSSFGGPDGHSCPLCGGDFIEDITTVVDKTSLCRPLNLDRSAPTGDYEFACSLSRDFEREEAGAASALEPPGDYDYARIVNQDFEREEKCERERRRRMEVGLEGSSDKSGIEGFAFVPPGNLYQSFLKPEDKLRNWGNAFNPYLYLDEEDEVVSDFPELGPPSDPGALSAANWSGSSISSVNRCSKSTSDERLAFQNSCDTSQTSASSVVKTRGEKDEN